MSVHLEKNHVVERTNERWIVTFGLLMSGAAFATDVQINDCGGGGHAPAPYDNQDCDDFCTYDSGSETLTCSVASCSGETATIVTDYNGTGAIDFSAWGTCDASTWCCEMKDDTNTSNQEIDTVVLRGSPDSDNLFFDYNNGASSLKPHRGAGTSITPRMQGRDGGDFLYGSKFSGSGFNEILEGDNGEDWIEGREGGDILVGGPEWDQLHGDSGNDRMQGSDGEDDLYGGGGDDTYCDTAEDSTSTCTANYFDEQGAVSADRFWLTYSATCDPSGDLDSSSTAGGGSDQCGPANSAAWGASPWTGCTVDIYSEPSQCP